MQVKEFRNLFLRNPLLAYTLFQWAGNEKGLAQIAFYPPSQLPETFRAYAADMGLQSPPALIVLPDEKLNVQTTSSASGEERVYHKAYYLQKSHAVVLSESVARVLSGEIPANPKIRAVADYLVTHELGHAKNRFSRRKFLNHAVAGAAGLHAGLTTKHWLDKATDRSGLTDPQRPGPMDVPAELAATAIGVAAGTIQTYGFMRLLTQGIRREEEIADAHSADYIGIHKVAALQAQNTLHTHPSANEIRERAAQLLDETPPALFGALSREEKSLFKALCVLEALDQVEPRKLRALDKFSYPEHAHRLTVMEKRIRQALPEEIQERGAP